MCGIVAYLGQRQAEPILIEGLKRLEYRGYDSAGLALRCADGLRTIKSVGRISNLENRLISEPCREIGRASCRERV